MDSHNIGKGLHDASTTIKDPGDSGTIVVSKSLGVCNLVSAAAETRTLSRPTEYGVVATLHMQTDGGDITLTVTGGYNENGDTTFTFSDVGQFAIFQSFETSTAGTYFWRLISHHDIANEAPGSSKLVNVTAATLTLSAASHAGKVVTINAAAGCAVTLPAATGTGDRYEVFIGTTVTSNTTTFTRAGSDTMFGMIYQLADGGSTLAAYELPGSTIITLDGSTKGGIKGDRFTIIDMATNVLSVIGHTSATGTEATPVT